MPYVACRHSFLFGTPCLFRNYFKDVSFGHLLAPMLSTCDIQQRSFDSFNMELELTGPNGTAG